MRIHYGTYRIAILLPWLGLAVKIPRIHIIRYLRDYPQAIVLIVSGERMALRGFIRDHTGSIEMDGSMRNRLLKGIWDNWREYWFWHRYRPRFTIPTYFSFLGLVTIQPLAIPYEGQEPLSQFEDRIQSLSCSRRLKLEDIHHFCNVENYGIHQGRVGLIDYGGYVTQKLLIQYQQELEHAFVGFKPTT